MVDFPEYRDEYYIDREVLLKECLPYLHIYKDKVNDYHEFFNGKMVSMLGFPTEDKVWLRKFILLNGGKAYHKSLEKPDILFMAITSGITICLKYISISNKERIL